MQHFGVALVYSNESTPNFSAKPNKRCSSFQHHRHYQEYALHIFWVELWHTETVTSVRRSFRVMSFSSCIANRCGCMSGTAAAHSAFPPCTLMTAACLPREVAQRHWFTAVESTMQELTRCGALILYNDKGQSSTISGPQRDYPNTSTCHPGHGHRSMEQYKKKPSHPDTTCLCQWGQKRKAGPSAL